MSVARKPIEGKVAEIISTRSLVLNVGREHGVTEGMVFAILNRKGDHIVDPDTKNELGSLRLPKVRVRVAYVDAKFSMARTFRTIGSGLSLSSTVLSIPGIFGGSPARTETLRTSDHFSSEEDLDEKDSIVKIGDPAIEVAPEPETPKEGQKQAT